MSRALPRVLAVVGVAAGACAAAPEPRQDLVAEILAGGPATKDAIAVRVGAGAIHAEEIRRRFSRRLAEGAPRATAREVAEDLVLEDIAADEAVRQGLGGHESVRHAARQALVEKLLREGFEEPFDRAPIPDDFLRRAYDVNYWFYNRYDERHVEHIRVVSPQADPAERRERAKAFAERLLAAARATPAQPLEATMAAWTDRAKAEGFELRYEKFVAPKQRLEKDFGDLLFETSVGELGARVASSSYGFHVLRCLDARAGFSRSFEAAREDIARRARPDYRRVRFHGWLKELRAKHRAEIADMAHLLFRNKAPAPGGR